MSDEVNLVPILVWTGLVGVQIGTAIRDGWKFWRQRQNQNSEFKRVCNGEIRHGWQMALTRMLLRLQENEHFYTFPRLHLFANVAVSESSLIVVTVGQLGSREVAQFRRYSLVSPAINSGLFKITYNVDQWSWDHSQYLSRRSVAMIFKNPYSSVYRFVVGDTCVRRMPRIFDVESPYPGAYLLGVYHKAEPKPRLIILLSDWNPEENLPWRFEFYLASYEIPTANENRRNPIRATSWETVSIPVGDRNVMYSFNIGQQMNLTLLYNKNNLAALESQLCVTFDGQSWRMASYPNSMRSMEETTYGAQVLDAFRSLDVFSPTPLLSTTVSGPLRHLENLFLRHPRLHLYKSSEGLLRRWCQPPSLRFLAAEALFRSKPNLTRDQLKRLTGFDFFEEIPDENEEDDTLVVYL